MLIPPLPMTRTFLTSTRLLPGFTTSLAICDAAVEAMGDSDAKRRSELENERSCCDRAGEDAFCCSRRLEGVDRVAVCEEKERETRAGERTWARQR